MKKLVVPYSIVLVLAAILYVASAAPGILWQDSGMYQYRVLHNDVRGNLGLALAHPLYHFIGIGLKYIPFGDLAYKVNLISAVSASIAVANIFLLIYFWLGSYRAAVIGAMTAAFSHTLWQHAAIAEVYATSAAFITLELILLWMYFERGKRAYLYLLALTNGLALANHLFAVLSLALYLVVLVYLIAVGTIRIKHVGLMAFLWFLGALPYEWLVLVQYLATGDLPGTIRSALFGTGWGDAVLNTVLSARVVKENLMFFAMNYPTPNIILFFVGLWSAFKLGSRKWCVSLLSLMCIYYIFAFRYTVPDRYAFFLPFYCIVPVFVAAGFEYLFKTRLTRVAFVACAILAMLPVAVYMVLPDIAKKARISLGTGRVIPYRDDYAYFLQPWKGCEYGPRKFAFDALTSVENNAIVFADGTVVYALLYQQQVAGLVPDVTIISTHGSVNNYSKSANWDELVKTMPVYVVSPVKGYLPQNWLEKYTFTQHGVLWKVNLKKLNEF